MRVLNRADGIPGIIEGAWRARADRTQKPPCDGAFQYVAQSDNA